MNLSYLADKLTRRMNQVVGNTWSDTFAEWDAAATTAEAVQRANEAAERRRVRFVRDNAGDVACGNECGRIVLRGGVLVAVDVAPYAPSAT